MEEIILTEDDLGRLEKRFGSAVRLMGSWNSDGTFGYTSVPLAVVMKTVEKLANAALTEELSRLKHTPERTTAFLELLGTLGSPLVAAIVTAYRESSPDWVRAGLRPAVRPGAAQPGSLVRTAAA